MMIVKKFDSISILKIEFNYIVVLFLIFSLVNITSCDPESKAQVEKILPGTKKELIDSFIYSIKDQNLKDDSFYEWSGTKDLGLVSLTELSYDEGIGKLTSTFSLENVPSSRALSYSRSTSGGHSIEMQITLNDSGCINHASNVVLDGDKVDYTPEIHYTTDDKIAWTVLEEVVNTFRNIMNNPDKYPKVRVEGNIYYFTNITTMTFEIKEFESGSIVVYIDENGEKTIDVKGLVCKDCNFDDYPDFTISFSAIMDEEYGIKNKIVIMDLDGKKICALRHY